MAKTNNPARGGAGVRGPINGCIVSLVGSGRATTRIALARALQLTPSTISFHVNQLLDEGVLFDAEVGTEFYNKAGRGRPARRLRLMGDGSATLAIDLGARQTRLAVVNVVDEILAEDTIDVDLADAAEAALQAVSARAEALLAGLAEACALRAVGMAVPGPIDTKAGTVILPSRMPGWAGFGVRGWLERRFGVPVAIENDANAMAYGEYLARPSGLCCTVTVKAGTGIGAGIIINGGIHRGATFGAGDITHVRVPAATELPCSCGNRGCLETIASGAALVRTLQEKGVEVETTADVVALALAGDPEASTAVRTAGTTLGQILAIVTNFFNPAALFVGGQLAQIEPFVAAIRSQIYQSSHPIATHELLIERVRSARDGVLIGMSHLAFEIGWDRSSHLASAGTEYYDVA